MPLASANIVLDALAISKCPGFLAQGGRALNLVLQDLVQHHNLKVNLVSQAIALPPNSNGPFNLELDYLRTYELMYVIDGMPYFLNPCNRIQFDADSIQPNVSNYPYEWATDLSPVAAQLPGLLYIFPGSNVSLTLTHRYFIKRADIPAPESSLIIPWFTDQDYLITATAARMMRITDDSRWASFVAMCDKMLLSHLLTEGDEQQVVKEVGLDPRRFRMARSLRPTKTYPW